MSESRWAHGLFASSADLREQANQPVQLTLVRRGVFVGTGNLFESLEAVHQQHPKLGDRRTFDESVGDFVDKAVRDGRFDFEPAPPVDLLTKGQMQAIRAYTLERPCYFDELNTLLYQSKNAEFDSRLNAWQEFLFNLDTGLKTLQQHQRAACTSAKKLFRICWIPQEILEQHFTVGALVVFKGACSASTEILEDFYVNALKKTAEIAGKRCVLLEFDEVACRQAVDIRFLSQYPQEEERLFHLCFRAKVESDTPLTEFVAGTKPRDSHPVRHVRLAGLRRVEPIQAILEWNGGISISKLLELAIIVSSHLERGRVASLTDALLQLEACVHQCRFSVVRALTEAVRAMPTLTALTCFALPVLGPVFLVHALPILVMDKGRRSGQDLLDDVAQSWARKLKALDGELQADFSSPEASFEKWRRNMPGYPELLHAVASGDAEEKEVIRSLASMLIEAHLVEVRVLGHPKELAEWVSGFHLPLSHKEQMQSVLWRDRLSEAQHQGMQPFTVPLPEQQQTEDLFHPVLAEIEVGEHLVARKEMAGLEAAKGVLASLDHLRLALSRTRIVVTLGPPDAGKTTLLNRVFGLRLPTGLSQEGRTKTVSLIPCPEISDILLADVPGFGDSEESRNDAVRLMVSLAKIKGLMQVLVVLRSGRHEQHPVDEILQAVDSVGVPLLVVMTQADERFLKLVSQPKPAGVKNKDWYQQKAAEIQAEDARRVQALFPDATPSPLYACLSGQCSPYYAEEQAAAAKKRAAAKAAASDEDDEEQVEMAVPDALKEAFKRNFQLVDKDGLQDQILGIFGAASASPSPATSSTDFRPPPRT